jgi:ubiquinone/menaquinone biosynthesis C-methylase UbiE
MAWHTRQVMRHRARYGVDGGYGGISASYFYSTGPGKLSVWKDLLDELELRGDEHMLDIGCGRGAVLISAAHRLSRGRATGADIWRLRDQTGNSQATAQRNAEIEGVSERVELVNADARNLPFPPESFDVVLSNLALSNIPGSEGRTKRFTKPSGSFAQAARCASSMTALIATPRSSRAPDAWMSRYVPSTGGRGPASPAITSRLSQPESQPPGLATSAPRMT